MCVSMYFLGLRQYTHKGKEDKPLKIYVYVFFFKYYFTNLWRYDLDPKFNKDLVLDYGNWKAKSILSLYFLIDSKLMLQILTD